jgi:hypothetical protein
VITTLIKKEQFVNTKMHNFLEIFLLQIAVVPIIISIFTAKVTTPVTAPRVETQFLSASTVNQQSLMSPTGNQA